MRLSTSLSLVLLMACTNFEADPTTVSVPDSRADLEAHGFTRKSIIVSLFSESGTMAVDQPQRIRVAASMGMKTIPTTLSFIEPDLHLARCGPGTPVGSGAVSGSTTPIGGATVPPGNPVVPPPTEPEASDS